MPNRQRRDRSKSLIATLFALPFLIVASDFALIEAGVGEPYPAIMMPGFRGTQMNEDGTIRVQIVEPEVTFIGSAEIQRPSLATLLDPMPAGMLMPTCSRFFRSYPHAAGSPPPRVGLKAWLIDHVLPLRDRRARQVMAGNPPSPETTRWIGERVARLYPGRRGQSVTFTWFRDNYRFRDGRFDRLTHDRIDTYRIIISR